MVYVPPSAFNQGPYTGSSASATPSTGGISSRNVPTNFARGINSIRNIPSRPYVPYNVPEPTFGDQYEYDQIQGTNVNQLPVNVIDVLSGRAGRGPTKQGLNYGIADVLNNYYSKAGEYLNRFSPSSEGNPNGYNLPTVSLNNNYSGPDSLNSALRGGVDYFGNLGISEGINNINAQRNASNAAIQNSLGRTAGNQSLISVLQNQNNLQSRLATQPLLSEAQQGTYQRALGNIGLGNDVINSQNQNILGQEGFNLQSALSGLNAQSQGLQPIQNLLDTLTSLQGQQRGVTSSESQKGSRNFK